jgi:lactate dehydrogenase-like 2-hydroxyacid dehydrogenase
MDSPTRIVFLDDDPVIRIARFALTDRLADPWIAAFFAPESVDAGELSDAARGLRASDGADIVLATGSEQPGEGADAIIFRRGVVNAAVFDANPHLRLVQRLGERPEGIDLAAAAERGIAVACVPRRTLYYTAEHAILMMLALAKRLLPADRAVREGCYDANLLSPIDNVAYNWIGMSEAAGLYGKTLGIVGLGEVGTIVARLARGFGMRVLYHKRRRASVGEEAALGVEYVELPALLGESDFVSLHAGSTPENENLAGRAFFAAMKHDAMFVNTTRGRLVDEDALFEALTNATIAGAGLDVHRIEPRERGDRFAGLANVVLTPHFAGGARSGVLAELAVILRNCHAAIRGQAPRFEVRSGAQLR